MGSARWCKACNSVHQSPTGSKCQRGAVQQANMESEQPQEQSETLGISDTVDQRPAVDSYTATGTTRSPMKSPTNTDSNQAILYELQKMTSRFGQIEQQAAADRAVIAGLVKRLDEPPRIAQTLSNSGLSTTQGSLVQNATSEIDDTQSIITTTDNIANITVMRGPSAGQKMKKSQTATQSQVTASSHAQAVKTTGASTNRNISNMQVPQGVYQVQMGKDGLEMRLVQGNTLAGDMINTPQATYSGITQQNATDLPVQVASQGTSTVQAAFRGARPKGTSSHNISQNRTVAMMDGQMETGRQNQTHNTLVQQPMGGTAGIPTNATHRSEWEKEGIPSLNTLRQATDLTQRVQERYRELEEANNQTATGKFELLLDALIKDKKTDKKKVKWPQDQAFIGVMRKRPSYEHLTICQWLLGFLRIQQEETDTMIRDNMIAYLCELMQDACDFTWDSAKGAHAVLLHRMADGVVDWTQLKEIHKIRKCYAQTNITTTSNDKKPNKVVPCIKFNKGICSRGGDHEWQGLMLKHMCQFCFSSVNKIENHARKDCWKVPKESLKN